MNIAKLCTSGLFPTYIGFRQLDKLCKQYVADEEFRKEIDSLWKSYHPMVVTPVR